MRVQAGGGARGVVQAPVAAAAGPGHGVRPEVVGEDDQCGLWIGLGIGLGWIGLDLG